MTVIRLVSIFTASLAKLTGGWQKAVKTTALDREINGASPRMQFHKLDRASDYFFRSYGLWFVGLSGIPRSLALL